MNPCKDCVVDIVCIKECPMFKIDLDRLQTDEEIYLKRCMNNIKFESCYKISKNIEVVIAFKYIIWEKDGKQHRDNDQPALITYEGNRYWYKNNKQHRENNKPAIIYNDGVKDWYKDGVRYEPM